jgi:hypothetical protein
MVALPPGVEIDCRRYGAHMAGMARIRAEAAAASA